MSRIWELGSPVDGFGTPAAERRAHRWWPVLLHHHLSVELPEPQSAMSGEVTLSPMAYTVTSTPYSRIPAPSRIQGVPTVEILLPRLFSAKASSTP